MNQQKPFSYHEHVRQRVLAAMRTFPQQASNSYGVLFYGDFDAHPEHYGLTREEQRHLQTGLSLRMLLWNWGHLDILKDVNEALDVVSNTSIFRNTPTGEESCYFLSNQDLLSHGIEPNDFDRLVELVHLKIIDVLQKHGTPEHAALIRDMKEFYNLNPDAAFDYIAKIKEMGYSIIDETYGDLYVDPIRDYASNILQKIYADNPESILEAFFDCPQNIFPDIYKKISSAPAIKDGLVLRFNHVGIQKKTVHPYILKPSEENCDAVRNTTSMTRQLIDLIFIANIDNGAGQLSKVMDALKRYQIPPSRYGFLDNDWEKVRSLLNTATELGLYKHYRDDEFIQPQQAREWLQAYACKNLFPPVVMDEMGIPRQHGQTFVSAYALTCLERMRNQLLENSMHKLTVQEKILMEVFFHMEDTTTLDQPALIKRATEPATVSRNQQQLMAMNFDQEFKAIGVPKAKGEPLEQIYNHFSTYPDEHTATIADYYPDMYARVLKRNGYDMASSAVPHPH